MKHFFTYCVAFLPVFLFSQVDTSLQQLDTIFSAWEWEQTPGLAGGIVKNGEIVYLHSAGLANLEHQVKVTDSTAFQVDELSKQFTTLALLLLVKQGLIEFDDPIQKYIPELPDYKHPLLIEHVVHHSTGLNDYSVVRSLKGELSTAAMRMEDALALIAQQSTLNFIPGTNFSYFTSDTESLLMARIIAQASGQSLAEYTKKHIFEPLGMEHTLFIEDEEVVIPNKAASYRREGETVVKNPVKVTAAGPTNLYTTVADLAAWYTRFHTNEGALSSLIHQLNTPVALDNGKTYDSYWGRLTLGRDFYHYERGSESYWHFGMLGGYSASVFRFPLEQITAFVLGNNMNYNGGSALQLAEHFMAKHYPNPPTIPFQEFTLKKVSKKRMQSYEGYYWYPKRGLARKISFINDTLRLSATNGDFETPLLPLSKNKFQLAVDSDDYIFLDFDLQAVTGLKRYEFTSGIAHPKYYEAYTPKTYSISELEDFTGHYTSAEYGVDYVFEVKEGELTTTHALHGTISFYPLMEDVFNSNVLALANIRFQRDKKGDITGFYVYTDGLHALFFERKKDPVF